MKSKDLGNLSEVESRTQGSRPRPRTQKNLRPRPRTAFPRTGTLEAKDRNARGQGPRTQNFSGDLQKKKRSSQKFFRRSPQKNVFQKIFLALHKILTIQKIVLSSSRGQANFRGIEASRPRTSKCVLEDSTSGIYVLGIYVPGQGCHFLTMPKYLFFRDLILKAISSVTSDLKKLI